MSIEIEHGEVHGLLGENGSGKSTLIKVLAGFHDPDPGGELEVNGRAVALPLRPGAYQRLGLSFVHQDLALMPSLSIAENLTATKISTSHALRINRRQERHEAHRILAKYGVSLPADIAVANLTSVERALLAIVRAVEDLATETKAAEQVGSGLLVLDEPTVFLPESGKRQLLDLVRQIASSGSSVLFVTHDLDEALEISDRITVLRNGRVAGTVVRGQVSKSQLIEMIIGTTLAAVTYTRSERGGEEAGYIQVEGLEGEVVSAASFNLARGEVLGLTGLLGSGFEEVPYLMFGATRARAGKLTIGKSCHNIADMTPELALSEAHMGLLPSDRQKDGEVGTLSARDNMMFLLLDEYFQHMRLRLGQMSRDAQSTMATYDVRPPEPDMMMESFSGGNQQKILLAKWLGSSPEVLLLDEPTQGVDVGARQQVFRVIRQAAERGCPVICASSDHEQLATICDRVLVFARGHIIAEVAGESISKERLTQLCLSGSAA